MGQAFDENNNVLAEAFADTKREVFDSLIDKAPDANRIEIHTVRPGSRAANHLGIEVDEIPGHIGGMLSDVLSSRSRNVKRRRKKALITVIEKL